MLFCFCICYAEEEQYKEHLHLKKKFPLCIKLHLLWEICCYKWWSWELRLEWLVTEEKSFRSWFLKSWRNDQSLHDWTSGICRDVVMNVFCAFCCVKVWSKKYMLAKRWSRDTQFNLCSSTVTLKICIQNSKEIPNYSVQSHVSAIVPPGVTSVFMVSMNTFYTFAVSLVFT